MTVIEDDNKNSIPLQDLNCLPLLDEHNHVPNKKPDTIFLYFTLLSAFLLTLSGGSSITWSSPVIPQIISNDTTINPLLEPATTIEISMMLGLPNLFGLIGTLLAPMVSDLLGRKNTLQVFAFFMMVCDIIIAFSNRILYIIIARCIFLIFNTGGQVVMLIYVFENCENHNRAKFGCLFAISMPLGCLFGYLIGPCFSVKIFTLITAIPLLIWLLASLFTYETPVYLLSNGKKQECLKALLKLRSNKTAKEIKTDCDDIQFSIKQRQSEKNANLYSFFKTKHCRVGIALAIIPGWLQFGSGGPVLLSFLGPIFNEADTGLSGNAVAILIGTIKVVCICLITTVVERYNRRTLLIISSLGCGFSLFIIGVFFYLKSIDSPIVSLIKWLPLVSVIIYYIIYSIGLGPLPPTVTGELFSSEFRSVGFSVLLTSVSVLIFFLSSGFPLLKEYAGIHWAFWVFCILCFVGGIGIYFTLPETRGKKILDIQEELRTYKFTLKRPVGKI